MALAALFAAPLTTAQEPLAARRPIQIPAEGLDSALQTLSRLRQVQLIFVAEDVAGRTTSGLSGELSCEEALRRLLHDTGLTYEFLDSRTVSIVPAPPEVRTASVERSQESSLSAAARSEAAADDVIVTSPPQLTESQLEALSVAFVQSHIALDDATGQLARWHVPLCPITLGLSAQMSSFVSDRVRQVGAMVGAPAPREHQCANSNIQIIFTTEPQKLLDAVAARWESVLGSHYRSNLSPLKRFSHVIQSWYATPWRSTLGSRLVTRDTEFSNVLVVVDAQKAVGYQIGAIADYIAALALSERRPSTVCSGLASIAELFADHCNGRAKPAGLSPADAALLRALYGLHPGESIYAEKSYITREVTTGAAGGVP